MAPRITIISVVKNDRRGLLSTLSSIAKQQTSPFEVIVVDGGSTDGSLELARSHSDAGVLLLDGPDSGIYDAMNKGLLAATGDYIWYLNAGDSLANADSITTVADFLGMSPHDWIYGAALPVDDEGHPSGPVLQSRLTRENLRRGLVHVNHQSMLMSTRLLRECDGFRLKFRLAAEYDLYLRATALTSPVPLQRVLVHFRVGGASFQHRAEHIREMGEARRENLNLTGVAALGNAALTRALIWRTQSKLLQSPTVRSARNAYLTRRHGGTVA